MAWPQRAPDIALAPVTAPAAVPTATAASDTPPAWTRWELGLFAGLVGLALVMRVWDLRDFPYAIHCDEILTGRNAIMGYLQGHAAPVFGTLWEGITAVSIRIL